MFKDKDYNRRIMTDWLVAKMCEISNKEYGCWDRNIEHEIYQAIYEPEKDLPYLARDYRYDLKTISFLSERLGAWVMWDDVLDRPVCQQVHNWHKEYDARNRGYRFDVAGRQY